jgi:hypothetical protein
MNKRIPPPAHPQILDYDPPSQPEWKPNQSLEEAAKSMGMTPAEIMTMMRAGVGRILPKVPKNGLNDDS